jgi:hypothetical protein
MARGYDAVIDTLAFTAADAADLLAEPAAHLTVISTASVYADAQGRGLETPDLGFLPTTPTPFPRISCWFPRPRLFCGQSRYGGRVARPRRPSAPRGRAWHRRTPSS